MNLQQFIIEYGYWALLAGTFLEGEALVVAAGFFAHRGYLDLPIVLLVSSLGTFLSGQFWYLLGRFAGKRIIARSVERQARVARLRHWMGRGDALVMAGFHFAIGFRVITPLALGAFGSNAWRYAVFNAAGSMMWAAAYALLGYFFGTAAQKVIGEVADHEWLIGLIVVIAGVLAWLFIRSQQKKAAPQTPIDGGDSPLLAEPPKGE
ncbi:MAG: DedA family protein [Phycisphaerales bacterium]|nr:DedA family protein [Phycisphaerales bacterium]